MPVRLGAAYPRGSRSRVFVSYVVGLRFKRYGIREMLEVCILTVGHSPSRTHASYPSCVTAYPRGSRSRVFTLVSLGTVSGNANHSGADRTSDRAGAMQE